jgi:hypothetical protein
MAAGAFVVVGLMLEVVGLGLVSAEDLEPWVVRSRSGVVRAAARIAEPILRGLGREGRRSSTVTVSDHAMMRDHASVTRGIDDQAEVEAKFAFLIDEARRTQERLNQLELAVEEEHVTRVSALNDLRREFDDAVRANIETSKARFLFLRRIGLAFLWTGSACLAIANLV